MPATLIQLLRDQAADTADIQHKCHLEPIAVGRQIEITHDIGPFRLNGTRLRAHSAMNERNDMSVIYFFELGVRLDVAFELVKLTREDGTHRMKESDCVRQTI
ncbi:MAG: hypothetical protein MMC33_007854 [Icmadophila ericetorum]|nr:hypothetical protein [Icmadophila ericetorum]